MEKVQKKIRKLLSSKHVILILCIVIIVIIGTLGINNHFASTGKTTHLGFENVVDFGGISEWPGTIVK